MIRKFAVYILTGGTAAGVDLGAFQLLALAGLPVLPAAVLSWLPAAVVNYILTSRFVFQRTPSREHGLVFLLAAALGLSINAGVTTVLVGNDHLDPIEGKVAGVGTAFIFNYLLNVLLVFR